jgi:hypothetical protein
VSILGLVATTGWSAIAQCAVFEYSAKLDGVADPSASASFIATYDDSAAPFSGTLELTFTYSNLDTLQSLRATNDQNDGFISNFGPFFPEPGEEQSGSMTRSATWLATDHDLATAGLMRLRVATLTPNEIGGPSGSSNGRVVVCQLITGNAQQNELEGTAGNDCIDGKGEADTMYGLGGDDRYTVNVAGDEVIEGAEEGNDTVRASATFVLPAHVEQLVLTGANAINGTGNSLANNITGNGAPNVLNGSGGKDVLKGLGGSDRLVGGAGSDTLNGGAGNDSFLFNATLNASTNVDKITDFNPVNDTIRLENAVFTALTTTGTLVASAFRAAASANTASQRLLYDKASGSLFYDADGNGSIAKVKFAVLTTKPTITNTDFVVQ